MNFEAIMIVLLPIESVTHVRILMVNGNAITVEILVIKHELARYFASDDLINDLK